MCLCFYGGRGRGGRTDAVGLADVSVSQSRMKFLNIKNIIIISSLSSSIIHCWFWGNDDDSEAVNEEKLVSKEEVDKNDEHAEVQSEDRIEKVVSGTQDMTQQQLNILNREEFERRLAETIKAHEIHHLSQDSHLDGTGEHDLEFDHEAFMGDEAEEFKHLTPEESKEKLIKIVKKIDVDNDTLIDLEELTNWIKDTQKRSVLR